MGEEDRVHTCTSRQDFGIALAFALEFELFFIDVRPAPRKKKTMRRSFSPVCFLALVPGRQKCAKAFTVVSVELVVRRRVSKVCFSLCRAKPDRKPDFCDFDETHTITHLPKYYITHTLVGETDWGLDTNIDCVARLEH